MKSFVRVAVLVSLVWFPSVYAAQPAAVETKGPVVVKQSPLLDLERWFREKIRQFGTIILPLPTEADQNCNPAEDPTGCTGVDRSKCPIG